ncbi:DeoR family transcriptional regulator [Actinocatenispora thailandica]|uniref:DeoR family transcriptional regulator n=1 Tax=Actinocatenispora thailandica TaxID=227318 RepID=A0A7R7HUA8_9ACTN|nr:sugar-binding domain-containing protein [Actinocatenispora thailandica]BCJ32632.1 DeoR family transcriptional regulator [Actinocatenispora thailandica]
MSESRHGPDAPRVDRRRLRGKHSQALLMARVARRAYLDQRTKVQIAEELGLSRFQVGRLLERARETGLVRIEIGLPDDVEFDLSGQLQERFGLRYCAVTEAPDESLQALRTSVGQAATALLEEVVTDRDVLGISSTRALMGLAEPPSGFSRCPVVQITGAVSRTDAWDVMEAVRRFTRVGGGPAYLYYAPMLCPDKSDSGIYSKQPDFVRCQRLFGELTVCALGIGAWGDGLSTVHEAASERDRGIADESGAVAEVVGLLLDQDGRRLNTPLDGRMIGISEAQLRSVPTRIGIAFDARKSEAVRATLASGLINGIVIDRGLAEAILVEEA